MENFKKRYELVKDRLGLNDTDVASLDGKTESALRAYLARKGKIHETTITAFAEKYGFDPDWLRDGKGELNIKNPSPVTIKEGHGVPYYDVEVTGTVMQSISDIRESPEYMIDYKPFNDCTAYLPIYGDSMFPKFRSGEVLAVKQIQNINSIQWGESYLVITNSEGNDMKTVKTVHPSDNNDEIILRASNPNYKGDQPVKKQHILSMYIVKGKISRDVM